MQKERNPVSNEIRIKKSTLFGVLGLLAGLGVALLVMQIPDIRREIRIWTM